MPTGIGYKVDPATGERTPYEYVYPSPQPAPQSFGGQGLNLNLGALNNVDADQASEAITAAIKYQGSRGYMQDVQNGVKPDMALSKWAPLMFYSRASTGAGSLVNALKPNPQVAFTPIPGGGQAVTLGDRLSVVRPPAPVRPPSNFQFEPPSEGKPGLMRDTVTGRVIMVPKESTGEISSGTAANIIFNPVSDAFAQQKLGTDYTNLVNKAKSGIVKSKATPPSEQAVPAEPSKPTTPKPGDVYKGYRFKGGNPSKKESWEKIQ